jgi:hypothetical protein
MKKTISLIILLITIILIYFYINKPIPKKTVNNSNLIEVIDENNTESKKTQLDGLNKLTPPENPTTTTNRQSKVEVDIELNYITAYREYKFFTSCFFFYSSQIKTGTLLENFIANKKETSTTDTEPTIQQIEQFNYYLNKCESLKETEHENNQSALARLLQRYKDIEPITDDEIALAKAIEIEKNIIQTKNSITDEKTGTSHQTKEEMIADSRKLLEISRRLQELQEQIRASNNPPTDEQNQQVLDLFKEMQEHRSKPNVVINDEEIALLQEELLNHFSELKQLFNKHQTPDVFLIFANQFLSENIFKERSFIDDELNNIGIHDLRYIASLNEVIIPFVACALNYPCDSQSLISLQYCINRFESHPQACSMSLDEYLLEVMLSPNQLTDINNYFSLLLDKYAQN